jgi:hypothetical protein
MVEIQFGGLELKKGKSYGGCLLQCLFLDEAKKKKVRAADEMLLFLLLICQLRKARVHWNWSVSAEIFRSQSPRLTPASYFIIGKLSVLARKGSIYRSTTKSFNRNGLRNTYRIR